MVNHCLLCNSQTVELYDEQLKVTYDVCHNCDFISKKKEHHLSHDLEEHRYAQHNNHIEDEGYTSIFKNLLNLHVRPLKNVKNILDFGSGPYPMLQKIFHKEGYHVTIFDPFFHNDLSYKDKKYDCIISTEVFEHLADPVKELDELIPLIETNGYLIIMTLFRPANLDEFLKWWYKRDDTHICFYNHKTFQYIMEKYNLIEIENNNKNIIVLQKQ